MSKYAAVEKRTRSLDNENEKQMESLFKKGNITLNTELTKLPKELAEYAILHELL
ncbi:MAG: hypothetical protein AOA66_1541 [Candidatus Bathyarchaeota archaeon BA2]|nr:MAG: hypothetical protein AOA66_1541 [Candidatus Bathyarchaeota archaeon BA2]